MKQYLSDFFAKLFDSKDTIINIVLFFLLVFVAQFLAIHFSTAKTNNVGKFNLSSERIAQDLGGKSIPFASTQWPFDMLQNMTVQVVGKKALDEFVVVAANLDAIAYVNKTENQKNPSKLKITGTVKLTYELINDEWYLLSIENLSLRPTPLD